MTNQEEALQILNETDKLGILHKGSLAESVAISCIVKALNEKDAKFKEFLEKKIQSIESMADISTSLPTDTAVIRALKEIINELFGGK